MTWLYSLYWLGVLAVAGPILFHLWRKTPRGERSFSTLMFLTTSPPRITSRSRIEHWLLLLLRAAAISLLALAFTRPLWRTPQKEPENQSTDELLVVVVDTSASMRREGVWNDLIIQVDKRIAELTDEVNVALFRFDRDCQPIADFHELKALEPSARRQLVRTRLKELKPSWERTQLDNALIGAATAIQEAQTERSRPARQRIWLASDMQSGASVIGLQGYEWPDQLPVELIIAKPKSRSNAGLQIIESTGESSDDLTRVRVTNSVDSSKERFLLRWDDATSPDIPVYVPPGQSRVIAVPRSKTTRTIATSIVLSGDDDSFDNRVYVTPISDDSRLVVYVGSESTDDVKSMRFYLSRLFAASNRPQIEFVGAKEANLGAAETKPSLLVITQPDPDLQTAIRRYLAGGGTILACAETPEVLSSIIELCGRIGITVAEANVSNYAMLSEIDFNHPLFAPFAESQFSDFTGIRFWKHRMLSGLEASSRRRDSSDISATAVSDRVLARFDDSEPAVVEMPVQGKGRLVVFTSGWQPSDSQFARSSKFPMLMFRVIEYSNGQVSRRATQSVGEPIDWPPVAQSESSSLGRIRLPDGSSIDQQSPGEPFTSVDTPGIYVLERGDKTEQVAVNLDPTESRTSPLTMEQLESYGVKLKGRENPKEQSRLRDRQRQLQLAELEHSQKLWQWVLIIVAGIIVIETLVSGLWAKPAPEKAM